MEAFDYIGPTDTWTAHATNQAYLTHQFQRKLKEFTERGGDAGVAEQVARHVAGRAELFGACRQAVLCHNDLHAGNLLATDTDGGLRLSGVLDFEGALAGDPLKTSPRHSIISTQGQDARCFVDTGRSIARVCLKRSISIIYTSYWNFGAGWCKSAKRKRWRSSA
jgi:aminoglycoside phosphotransferase (APT) family kinase protein